MALPAGIVTLLFSDIEGSTRLLERLGDGYVDVLEQHRTIVRSAVARHEGQEVRTEGDAFFVAFTRARDAVLAAVDAQRGLSQSEWPPGGTVRVRMGVHTGEPRVADGDYVGLDVHCAARICSAAHGGQVVVSEATQRVLWAAPVEGVSFQDLGVCRLKDITRPVGLHQVRAEGLLESFPPLRGIGGGSPLPKARDLFVGRDPELAQLLAAVDDAPKGAGSLFWLSGEPGIGKTRLVEEFAARASERGARVVTGRCWESGGAPAYWPWVQCLRALVQEAEPATLAAHLGAGAADVAQIAPELREALPELSPPPALDPEDARFRLFDAVASYLGNASAGRPLVVVLEDIHAADAPSLLLLRFVARELARLPLVVVATVRDTDPGSTESLAATLAELTRLESCHELPLRGLGHRDVAVLVDAEGGEVSADKLVAAIHERTEGHPFFVREVVRMLASGGGLDALPRGVGAVVAQRLGLLSKSCRGMLAVAAVVGREFEVELLADVGDVEPGPALELLEEALAAKVIVDVPGAPGRFRFEHALVREVLYDDLAVGRRTRLHRRVGETLEAMHDAELDRQLPELAHHFFLAAPAGTAAKAVSYARRAGDRASGELAYEEATRLLDMALTAHELAPEADAHVRGELLLALGAAQASANDMVSGKETFVRAADVARRSGAAEHLARAALGYGGSMVVLPADDPQLVPLLEEALEALGEDRGVLRARLLARLACADLRLACGREALDLARRLDDPATLAWALHAQLVLVWGPDNLDELLAITDEMVAVAERDANVEQALNGRLGRLELLVMLGKIAAAHDELTVAARLAEQLRLPSAHWHVAVHETGLALLGGRFAEADALIVQAQRLGERSSNAEVTTNAVVQRFPLLLERRRVEELRAPIQEIAAANPDNCLYPCLLARVECERGNHAVARSMLASLASDDWRIVRDKLESLLAMAVLAETAALLVDRERASELLELLTPYESLIASAPHCFPMGAMSRYLGLLADALSRFDEAARRLEAAAATNVTIGALPWVAHAKADHARVLLARRSPGDRERARDLAGEARAVHEQLGMTASADKAAALLTEPVAGLTSAGHSGTLFI